MKLKRAVWISVLAYIATFVVGILVAIAVGIDFDETQVIPPLLWYTGAVVSVIFAAVFALWYFRPSETVPSAKHGFLFGIVMIVTGFVLDFLTLLPLFTHDDPLGPLLAYYMNPFFWITVVFVIVTATLTGKKLENDRQRS